jgi:type 1 glutamine amidotransferase
MPEGLDKALDAAQLRDLLMFLLLAPLDPAPLEIRGEPPPRNRAEVEAVLKTIQVSPEAQASPRARFEIVLCAGPKDHGLGEHDYPLWQKRWTQLLSLGQNVKVGTAWEWPSAEQWQSAHTVVFYSNNPGWNTNRAAELDRFLARGGGLAYVHFAVDGHQQVEALAQRIGLAWRGGFSKFRHGPLDLHLQPSPLTARLGPLHLVDESYWNLVGDMQNVQLVATGIEEGNARPLMWTRVQGPGRVFVSIPGHYTWTFDDPFFRLLLLARNLLGGHQPIDRLSNWP